MHWENEPATRKRLRFLRQHGYKPDRHLTKSAATELIHSLGGNVATTPPEPLPMAIDPLPLPEEPLSAELDSVPPPAPVIAHLLKHDAYDLRAELEKAQRAAVAGINDNGAAAQQEVALAFSRRQMFWIDTCRDPTRMQAACGQILEFYRKYGCQFEAPSNRQVQEVLGALDSVLPHWDRDHLELFYKTLELNFPELLKRR